MSEPGAALRAAIDRAMPRLEAIDDAASARRPAPDRWCAREIVGHLIDSAANNHGRFVRAQLTDDLVFVGYAQDEWVALQGYREASWRETVALWASYNRHLSRVMSRVSPEVAARPRPRHNLHELAWGAVPADGPATLAWFMEDYVAHLEHHLRQVWSATGG